MNPSEPSNLVPLRELIRQFERELFIQNCCACCKGVTLAQCHTLLEINSKGKESVTELAKSIGLDKSTVSRTVDGLVSLGLVDRSIPATNRRTTTLELTDAGKNACTTIHRMNDAHVEDMLSALSNPEKSAFIGSLEKIVQKMIERRSKGSCC
jgi:DNA-binding MarR family transcriptional regulator